MLWWASLGGGRGFALDLSVRVFHWVSQRRAAVAAGGQDVAAAGGPQCVQSEKCCVNPLNRPALRAVGGQAADVRRRLSRILGPVKSDRSAMASYFNGWYADMASTPAKDEVMQRHLGLPQHLVTTSTIPWRGIAELETALHLAPDDTLLDLACGRGGIGLEIAARRSCRLIRLSACR